MGKTAASIVLLASLAVAAASAAPAAEPPGLLFGFAKRVITPEISPRPVYLAGPELDRAITARAR